MDSWGDESGAFIQFFTLPNRWNYILWENSGHGSELRIEWLGAI